MTFPQIVNYAGLPVVGVDMIVPRGPRPGTCRLPLPGLLDLQSNSQPVRFGGCVPDLSTIRTEYTVSDHREYSVLLWDRRKTWERMTVSGRHNHRLRDNTIEPSSQQPRQDLFNILLQEVGEPDSNYLQADVYPSADWDETPVVEAFEQLCALYPAHVCRAADDSYKIYQTGQGDELPDPTILHGTVPDYRLTAERGPSRLVLACGPTWFQDKLLLNPVGLDSDGQWKSIPYLSYTPSGGWGNEHPFFFAPVDPDKRHLAARTVFRCFQVVPGNVSGYGGVSSLWQYELDDYLVELKEPGTADTPPGLQPAFVRAEYWPYGDHPYNTSECIDLPGNFTIDKENRMIVFDYPVFRLAPCAGSPTLHLFTGFRLREPNGAWVRKTFSRERVVGG